MKQLALPIRFARQTGRILDIGSGNNCLDIATHIVDMIPDQDVERGGKLEVPDGKQFKEGSLEAIPYADGYFDFAHASHVLEHSLDPRKAISELQRIASAGYIETPAAVMEQGCFFEPEYPGWRFHRWYVWAFPGGNKIYIKPKTERNLREYCTCRFGTAFTEMLARGEFSQLDPFVPYHCKMTQFAWETTIPFEIWEERQQGKNAPDGSCDCAYAAFFAQLRVYFKTLRQIQRRFRFKRSRPEQFELARKYAALARIS